MIDKLDKSVFVHTDFPTIQYHLSSRLDSEKAFDNDNYPLYFNEPQSKRSDGSGIYAVVK